jgi:hypothetical protein
MNAVSLPEVVRWKVIGFSEKVFQPAPGEPWRAAGCCDKCGQTIRYVVTVKSSEGRVMDVGQDCAVTLEGGPELAEIRTAERKYQYEQWLASPEYAQQQERERNRVALEKKRAAMAEEVYPFELAGFRAILASPNCSQFEKDHASRAVERIVAGKELALDFDSDERIRFDVAVAKAFLPPAGIVGIHGDKMERTALFEAMITLESPAYGTRWLRKFRANDGAVMVWISAAGDLRRSDIGRWVTIRGTVKTNGSYNGEPQTTLLRCKVSR